MKNKLNNIIIRIRSSKRRWTIILLLIVVLASAAMIVMNYYTIRILSAARAYINGESQYSKSQKDASVFLTNYIYLENETDFTFFNRNIKVPAGDSIARAALLSKSDYRKAREGFLIGNNHPDDIDDMIWLFSNFKHLGLSKKAISIWSSADSLVSNLHFLGIQAHQKIIIHNISTAEKKSLILSIGNISSQLTIKEKAFSDLLGVICRSINKYIFLINGLITLIIVISSLSYAGILISNLANSKREIIEQINNLEDINAGLDKFVSNVTHDLRSPLASMVGLVNLIEDETDAEAIKSYTLMIRKSLDKQDQFIREMLTFIKSKDTGKIKTECSLKSIIDNVLTQIHFDKFGKRVNYYKEVDFDKIYCDPLKIQIILNNLISNSIKYCDQKKEEQWVRIKTYQSGTDAVIEVEDNGIGIQQSEKERIFEKFYSSNPDVKSTGIGLYLVKDALVQMNGSIELKSEPGINTKFKVKIPL